MTQTEESFRIAAVQATPVFLDRQATVAKACALIAEAGAGGAKLAVFPEAFIPSFPVWVWFIPAVKTHEWRELHSELLANSVAVPGPEIDLICDAAREAGVAVVMGINEVNREASGTTVYDTLVFISASGEVLGRHRKLMPTAGERIVWGQGDGSGLQVHDLGFARLAGLLCWENYMPLARYTLYAEGAQIWAAPTFDRGEPWVSTLRHIAKEGRTYVVGCCSPYRRDDIPDRLAFKEKYLPDVEWLNSGDSTIIDPDGKFLVEPVQNREEILYAEVDPAVLRGPRFQLDVAGHYSRPDIFRLAVDRRPRPMLVELHEGADPDAGETENLSEPDCSK